MLAAVLHEPRHLRIDEVDAPQPQPGQVQIRVRAGGICGSDLSYYFKGKSGDFAVREPFVLPMQSISSLRLQGRTNGSLTAKSPLLPLK